MTPDIDALLTPDVDPVEIVNGRYRIPHPDTGKPQLWTRATTLAKTLDDQYNLTLWKLRRTAVGIASTPSLAAAVYATPDDDDRANRRRLDELVEQAQEKAGSGEGRDLGSALHKILERVDRGQLDPSTVPDPWKVDVDAWRDVLRHKRLTVRSDLVEVCVLNPTLGIAGRVDNVLTEHDGTLVIADKKTGGHISWLSFAMQFAAYATATHTWDGHLLAPMPTVRQDYALLVHNPAGSGVCRLWKIDIGVGYGACLMALEVRRQRAIRPQKIGTAYDVPGDTIEPEPLPVISVAEFRVWLRDRIDTLKTGHVDAARALAAQWPAGIPTLARSDTHTTVELEQIEAVIDRVEAGFQVPFGTPKPTPPTAANKKAEAA